MKHRLRYYERVRRIACFFLRPWLKHRFQWDDTPLPELPERFLLVTNHVTKLDPFFIMTSARRFMFFVATEHLFSLGLLSKIIVALGNPIPRSQGGSAASTVMEVLRRVKIEGSVGICVEGNCSWNGLTDRFLPATGKMVRAAGVPLVTVKIQGYLALPRWAYTHRKGPVRVSLAGIYQSETLKAMTPEAINALIARDIAEDAYRTAEEHGARYPGKRLAEGLEHALLFCPRCHGLDCFHSRRNSLTCHCGFSVTYDETGHLKASEGETPFTTLRDWDQWQKDYLGSLPEEDLPRFQDEDMQLLAVEGHKRNRLTTGPLHMDATGLHLGERSFALEDIANFAIRYKGIVSFSDKEGQFYEILKQKKKAGYNGRKYLLLYQRLCR